MRQEGLFNRAGLSVLSGLLKLCIIALVMIAGVLAYGHSTSLPKLQLAAQSVGQQTGQTLSFGHQPPQAHQQPPQTPPQPPVAAAAASVSHVSAEPSQPVAPNCSPSKVNPTPSALALTSSGLQQVVDAPVYYQVYGFNGSAVYQQIMSCTPVSEQGRPFAASTNYYINWHYSYKASDQACVISNVSVGVHVNQVYPQWMSAQSDTADYNQRWQAFMAGLQVHENGHRDLDLQYASKILNDLQNLPPTDCANIAGSADGLGNADLAALNQANTAYANAPNHGASQGAVIPQ